MTPLPYFFFTLPKYMAALNLDDYSILEMLDQFQKKYGTQRH